MPPTTSKRAPLRRAPRPVKRLIAQPTPNSAAAVRSTDAPSAPRPALMTNGASGTAAPTANDTNDEAAAAIGEPSDAGSSPSSSRASVSSASSGFAMRWLGGPVGVLLRQPARLVDERQLRRLLLGILGELVALGADLVLEHLALRADRDVLAGRHRERPRQQARHARDQHGVAFALAPATPRMRQRFETSPSLAPNTAGRRLSPPACSRWRRPISSTEWGMACPPWATAAPALPEDRHPADLHASQNAAQARRTEPTDQRSHESGAHRRGESRRAFPL